MLEHQGTTSELRPCLDGSGGQSCFGRTILGNLHNMRQSDLMLAETVQAS